MCELADGDFAESQEVSEGLPNPRPPDHHRFRVVREGAASVRARVSLLCVLPRLVGLLPRGTSDALNLKARGYSSLDDEDSAVDVRRTPEPRRRRQLWGAAGWRTLPGPA